LFVRDFIVLHYKVTEREDTQFWRHCKNMPIPDSLQHRIDLFKETGKVFQKAGDVFAENSWTQVMLGQGLMPEQYHSIVNMMSDDELKGFLENIKFNVDRLVEQLPSHQQFLNHYCRSEAM
jgi:tryptophan halogenase